MSPHPLPNWRLNNIKELVMEQIMGRVQQITSRTRKLGWAWSDTSSPPVAPLYTGTISQLCRQIKSNREFNMHRGAKKIRWFYDGLEIARVLSSNTIWYGEQRNIDTLMRLVDAKLTSIEVVSK